MNKNEYVYVVNQRGRGLKVREKDLEKLLLRGFIRITKNQFESDTYFSQFDKGQANIIKTTYKEKQEIPKNDECSTIRTTIFS